MTAEHIARFWSTGGERKFPVRDKDALLRLLTVLKHGQH